MKKKHETGLYAREFAALYGLTRETLLYYDKIGLFHPALRGENGYRLYALDQIPQFDFLLLLRDAGVPLSDIRQVLQTATPQQTLSLLRAREEKVRTQIKALRRLEKRIAFTAGRMETGLHTVCERPPGGRMGYGVLFIVSRRARRMGRPVPAHCVCTPNSKTVRGTQPGMFRTQQSDHPGTPVAGAL